MLAELGEEQYKLIKTIAGANGFQNYKLDLESGSIKGDGYMGRIISVVIKDGERKLSLILKLVPKPGNSTAIPVRDVYLKEIYMYEKMFVAFEKFQTDNCLMNGFKGYAKFYGKCDKENNECLALENLVESGYKLWNRKIPMNSEHITLLMTEYGKLHAVSFAMRYKNPTLFKEITNFLVKPVTEVQRQNLKKFIDSIMDTVPKAIKGNVKAENAFKKLMSNPMKFFLEDMVTEENYFVVNHGDCWCNNVLFKYKLLFQSVVSNAKMLAVLSEEQHKLITTIAEANGFQNYKLDLESGSMKGDGYAGKIISVAINDGERKLSIILKLVPKHGNSTALPVRDVYLKEIYMYEKIFASFEKFQTDNCLMNGFKGYAKFYGKCDKENNECLALENLVESDYKLWNRKIPMNSEHITLLMTEYGKLHAVSFAMRDKNPTLFKEITNFLVKPVTEVEHQNMRKFIDNIMGTVPKTIKGNVKAENAFQKLISNSMKFFLEDMTSEENYFVVTHGDCWCNNVLFKYKDPHDDNKPSQVCLIDWQISRLGNPVIDIAYSMCANSPLEIIHDYMVYLKIYYDSLCENLRNMSCDPEEIYPFSLLEQHWKKYAKYALYIVPLIFKISAVESEEAPDLTENTRSVEDFYNNLNNTKTTDAANQRFAELFVVMDELGCI